MKVNLKKLVVGSLAAATLFGVRETVLAAYHGNSANSVKVWDSLNPYAPKTIYHYKL